MTLDAVVVCTLENLLTKLPAPAKAQLVATFAAVQIASEQSGSDMTNTLTELTEAGEGIGMGFWIASAPETTTICRPVALIYS